MLLITFLITSWLKHSEDSKTGETFSSLGRIYRNLEKFWFHQNKLGSCCRKDCWFNETLPLSIVTRRCVSWAKHSLIVDFKMEVYWMFEAILCVGMQADIDQLCSDWPLTLKIRVFFPTEINDIRRKPIRKLSLETSQSDWGSLLYSANCSPVAVKQLRALRC